MADDNYRTVALQTPKLLQMLDGPLLQGAHALTARWPAGAAAAIPALPCGVFIQNLEFQRRPVADVDLINGRHDFHRHTKMPAENGGGLLGSPLRARLQRRGSLAYEPGATRHLPAAQLIELDAGHPAAEPFSKQRMMTVAHQ